MREERDMEKIKIKYLSDKIERLRYIDGKSDWIDPACGRACRAEKGRISADSAGGCHAAATGV